MNLEPMRSKAKTWWRHGKHAKIDPHLLQPAKPPERPQEWHATVAEAFGRQPRRRQRS